MDGCTRGGFREQSEKQSYVVNLPNFGVNFVNIFVYLIGIWCESVLRHIFSVFPQGKINSLAWTQELQWRTFRILVATWGVKCNFDWDKTNDMEFKNSNSMLRGTKFVRLLSLLLRVQTFLIIRFTDYYRCERSKLLLSCSLHLVRERSNFFVVVVQSAMVQPSTRDNTASLATTKVKLISPSLRIDISIFLPEVESMLRANLR